MDRYTKAVLTVIAVALVAIAFRMGVPPAAAQFGAGCGTFTTPCFVEYGGRTSAGMPASVTNWPSGAFR